MMKKPQKLYRSLSLVSIEPPLEFIELKLFSDIYIYMYVYGNY